VRQDQEALTRLAHQLKGAAGGYGFAPISAAAGQLEHALRDGSPAREPLDVLLELCTRACALA
jgi:HPt (histidine-containing phosphotransfer) domain-containing protein